jgi:hypothetical protein
MVETRLNYAQLAEEPHRVFSVHRRRPRLEHRYGAAELLDLFGG